MTALAVQALAGREDAAPVVARAVAWLLEKKNGRGLWYSTHATVQTLRALLAAEPLATPPEDAEVTVSVNGQRIERRRRDTDARGLLHTVDAGNAVRPGQNTVTLETSGAQALPYQVVGRYHVPWDAAPPAAGGPLGVTVAFDRRSVVVGDTVGVTATVTNTGPEAASVVMAELGVPPGFTLVPDALERAVSDGEIEKFTPAGRHVHVYLKEVPAGGSITVRYALLARHPLSVRTPASVVYAYYRPGIRAEAPPVRLTVTE